MEMLMGLPAEFWSQVLYADATKENIKTPEALHVVQCWEDGTKFQDGPQFLPEGTTP